MMIRYPVLFRQSWAYCVAWFTPVASSRFPWLSPSKSLTSPTNGSSVSRSVRTSEPRSGLGLREGHVDALAEQEFPQVKVVDAFTVLAIRQVALVELLSLEPFNPADVTLKGVKNAAFGTDPFVQVVEQRPQDALGELSPRVVDVRSAPDGTRVGEHDLRAHGAVLVFSGDASHQVPDKSRSALVRLAGPPEAPAESSTALPERRH